MNRPPGSAADLKRRRRQAVASFQAGERPSVVARVLGIPRSTLFRWRQMAQQGPDGLAAKPARGHPPRLSDQELHQLDALLRQGAKHHGWPNQLWTCARVAQLIRRHFGVSFHPDHVGRFLRQRLGWSPQKPRRQARERDDEAVAVWLQETFPHLWQDTCRRDAHLVLLDESGFQLTLCLRRSWAPLGATPIVEAWDRRDRISAISCLTISPRQQQLNRYFELLPDNTNVRAEQVVDFLRQLHQSMPGGLTVVWDRHRIHSRSRLVKAWLAEHPDVQVADFPAYSPALNPDEGVWSWLKHGQLANLAAYDTGQLRDLLMDRLIELKYRPDLLAAFVHQTDLPLLI